MKKFYSSLIGVMLIILLAACNQTAEPVEKSEADEGQTQNETTSTTEQSQLTVEEVLNKSMEASEGLKSFAMKMDLQQEMSSSVEEEKMNIHSSIDMKVVTEPIAFYQKMSMELADSPEAINTEAYFTEDGMYLYDAAGGTWMKFPTEMSDQMLQMSGQENNPAEELKKLQEFVEDFTFKQDNNSYILELSASGEKFTEFIQETIEQTLPPEIAADATAMNDMKINEVKYEIVIDKKTYFPQKMNIQMSMDITSEGQTITINQKMNGEYSSLNEIDKIAIPQEIMDTATELEL